MAGTRDEVYSLNLELYLAEPDCHQFLLGCHESDIRKLLGRHAFKDAAINRLTLLVATDLMEEGLLKGLVRTRFDLGFRSTLLYVFLTATDW